VFKVIQDQQNAAAAQECGDSVVRGSGADLVEVERVRDSSIEVGGILERHEIDKPDTVREGRFDAAGRGERQSGLADTAGSRDRQETPGLAEEVLAQDLQLAIPADQGRRI
jgi:hypothetical protein